MHQSLLKRMKIILPMFLCCFLVLDCSAQESRSNEIPLSMNIESLVSKIDSLEVEMSSLREEITSQTAEKLSQHADQIQTLINHAISLSGSNTSNYLTLLGLVLGIMALCVALVGLTGGIIVKQMLNKLQSQFEDKFDQKSREFDISIEESRANFYLSTGQYQLARIGFEKIIEWDPENYNAHEKLGFLFLGDILDQPDRAVFHNKKAIEIKPNNPFPYINLQVAVDHAKFPFEENEQAYQKALEISHQISADEMTFGKIKLFFADKIRELRPKERDKAKKLYEEALVHFQKVEDPRQQENKDRWIRQTHHGIDSLSDTVKS